MFFPYLVEHPDGCAKTQIGFFIDDIVRQDWQRSNICKLTLDVNFRIGFGIPLLHLRHQMRHSLHPAGAKFFRQIVLCNDVRLTLPLHSVYQL